MNIYILKHIHQYIHTNGHIRIIDINTYIRLYIYDKIDSYTQILMNMHIKIQNHHCIHTSIHTYAYEYPHAYAYPHAHTNISKYIPTKK